MKPDFALTLSHDGVTLLHRSARGWLTVGEVALGDPGFEDALAAMRTRAQRIAPEGLFSKLIIPPTELLYTTVSAPDPDPEARRTAVRRALEGATPYAVDELVFDWSGSGGTLHVAVVARETLEEAESFALRHGFNPVSFVACPENGAFIGEPFFGPASAAPALTGPDGRLERDLVPVRVVGRAEPPASDPRPIFGRSSASGGLGMAAAEVSVEKAAATAAAPGKAADGPEATEAVVPSALSGAVEAGAATPANGPAPAGAPEMDRAGAETAPRAPRKAAGDERRLALRVDATGAAADTPAAEEVPEGADAAARFSSRRRTGPPDRSAPAAAATPQPEAGDTTGASEPTPTGELRTRPPVRVAPLSAEAPAATTAPAVTATPAPGGEGAAVVRLPGATATRAPETARTPRTAGAAKRPEGKAATGTPAAPAGPDTRPDTRPDGPGLLAGLTTALRARLGWGATAGPAPQDGRPDTAAGAAVGSAPPSRTATTERAAPDGVAKPGAALRARPGTAAAGTTPAAGPKPRDRGTGMAPSVALLRARSSQPLAADGTATEAEAMTVFGARRRAEPRGSARLGLALTGALVLVLAAVGVWAAYFLTAPERAAMEDAAGPALTGDGVAALPRAPNDAAALPDDPADALAAAVEQAPEVPTGFAPFNIDEPITEEAPAVAPGEESEAADVARPELAAEGTGTAPPPGADAALPDASVTAPPPAFGVQPQATTEDGGAETGTEPPATGVETGLETAAEAAPTESEAVTAEAPEAEAAAPLAEVPPLPSPEELAALWPETGVWPVAPGPTEAPRPLSLGDLRGVAPDQALPDTRPEGPEPPVAGPAPLAAAPPPPFDPAVLGPAAPPPASAPLAEGPGAALSEVGLIVPVIDGTPPLVPGLRRSLRPRHQVIEGGIPVPAGIAPAPRPAGLGGEGALRLPEAPQTPPAPDAAPVRQAEVEAEAETAATAASAPDPTADGVGTAASLAAAEPDVTEPSGTAAAAASLALAALARSEPEQATPVPPVTVVASAGAIALRPAVRPEALQGPPGPTRLVVLRPAASDLRPSLRPAAVAAAAAAAVAAARDATASATAQAVAQSLVPGARPTNFAAVVARARPRTPAAAPATAPATAAAAATATAAAAPAPAAAAPSLPTRASVAQQATQTRAINLREINLIGVFGTSRDRRALVRMPNGRIVALRVGDRFEGGQVAAIGEDELRYVRGSRNTVLRLGG